MEVTFGRESHPSREGPPATLITHYQCHHPEHTIHVHSVLSVPSFYTLWTNIKTISTIVRPPSQSNYNHPSSTSGPTPSLDILLLHLLFLFLLLLLFIFLSVLSIISVRLSLISKLKGPGWLLHRCGLVWSITPLGSPMVSRGHTGWLILSPVDSQELLVVDLSLPLWPPSSSIQPESASDMILCLIQVSLWQSSHSLGKLDGNINISILDVTRWLHGVDLMHQTWRLGATPAAKINPQAPLIISLLTHVLFHLFHLQIPLHPEHHCLFGLLWWHFVNSRPANVRVRNISIFHQQPSTFLKSCCESNWRELRHAEGKKVPEFKSFFPPLISWGSLYLIAFFPCGRAVASEKAACVQWVMHNLLTPVYNVRASSFNPESSPQIAGHYFSTRLTLSISNSRDWQRRSPGMGKWPGLDISVEELWKWGFFKAKTCLSPFHHAAAPTTNAAQFVRIKVN